MPLIRHPRNPIITRRDIPEIPPYLEDVSSVFNPGAVKVGDRYFLLLRVQNRARQTFLVPSWSQNGVDFESKREVVSFEGLDKIKDTIYHIYDPRITALEGAYYILVALDMEGHCELGLARTTDFTRYDFLGILSQEDVRNGVLFPEKVGGRYLRLDRPNRLKSEGGLQAGDTICLSESDDLIQWRPVGPVISGRWHYWDERIGSGPPPVKTRAGWLHLYHGIATHFESVNIYQAGVLLLDLEDPSIVVARSHGNILEPRELYEQVGQVPNVVFPSGMIVERYDTEGFAEPESEVKIYYGAADTCVGLATTTVKDLIEACYV
jgi:beta-1,4-mannooligosaccharide/beta-1,4-mannosyl-N-acetylglucosamine phosphorylase